MAFPRRSAIFGTAMRNSPLISLRARPGGVAGGSEADCAREAAEAALDQVEAGLAARPARRFVADDEEGLALGDQADGRRVDARHINHDFDGLVCFVDIDRGRAFPGKKLPPNARPSSRKTCRTSSAKSPTSEGIAIA